MTSEAETKGYLVLSDFSFSSSDALEHVLERTRALVLHLGGLVSEPDVHLKPGIKQGDELVWNSDSNYRVELNPLCIESLVFTVDTKGATDIRHATLTREDLFAFLFGKPETVVHRKFDGGGQYDATVTFVVRPHATDPIERGMGLVRPPPFDPKLEALRAPPTQNQGEGEATKYSTFITDYISALNLLPPDHESHTRALFYLGSVLLAQSINDMDRVKLSRSISLQQAAIEATPKTHPDHAFMLNSLALSLARRYNSSYTSSDLGHLATAIQEAINAEQGITDHAALLARAGELAIMRFQHSVVKSVADISLAVDSHQQAVAATPADHPEYPGRVSSLGRALTLRFTCTKDLADLDQAIAYEQQGVDLTPDSDERIIMRLTRLGSSLMDRFDVTSNLEDLNKAIKVTEEAVAHPKAGQLGVLYLSKFFLGYALVQRFDHLQDKADLVTSAQHVLDVANNPSCSARLRLNCATMAVVSAMKADDLTRAKESCTLSLAILPECVALEQTAYERFSNLSDIFSTGIVCTRVALHFGDVQFAVECFEKGRCITWTQIEHFQTPTDRLASRNPALAKRFKDAARVLQYIAVQQSQSSAASSTLTNTEAAQRAALQTQIAQEWKDVLAEIRKLPSFATFLRPPEVPNILEQLPPNGHVILLNISYTRCDALALTAGRGITHIELKGVNAPMAQEMANLLQGHLKEQGVRLRGDASGAPRGIRLECETPTIVTVLADLWSFIVKPTLDGLGISGSDDLSTRPRVWWCPSGCLSSLPIHAAGMYSEVETGSCASDYIISSYTPNVSALLRMRNQRTTIRSQEAKVLLVSQPDTPGLSPILFTREETNAVGVLLEGEGIHSTTLESADATMHTVPVLMKSHPWAHFACHAIQNRQDPLASGVHLYDGKLALRDIMKENVPNTEHVFLSACQTGAGDETLAEEVVHLAAGMLAAGYRGVVATLWSIQDCYGPDIATEFYRHLVVKAREKGMPEGCLDCEDSASALDHAIRRIREMIGDDGDALLAWVPYVHWGV